MEKEKKKLDITFYNPNTDEETAKYIFKTFMKVCQCKVEQALVEAKSISS